MNDFQAVVIVNDYAESHDSILDIVGKIQQHLLSKIICSTNQKIRKSLNRSVATMNLFITIQFREANLDVQASTDFKRFVKDSLLNCYDIS